MRYTLVALIPLFVSPIGAEPASDLLNDLKASKIARVDVYYAARSRESIVALSPKAFIESAVRKVTILHPEESKHIDLLVQALGGAKPEAIPGR